MEFINVFSKCVYMFEGFHKHFLYILYAYNIYI